MENNERRSYQEMMKANAKKFVAGQVWYWQDPIFGAKGESDLNLGEGSLRFSRYVLLLQNSDGRRPTIMVAPLTTKGCCSLDVGLYMPYGVYGYTHTYVKTDGVTTVNIHQLKKYVCTLTTAQMEMVQEAIWGSLFDDVTVPEDTPSESEYYCAFEEFMNNTEWIEYDPASSEPGATLRDFYYAFSEYCRCISDIRPQGDMFEVARYFKVSTGDDFPIGKYGTIQKNGLVVHIPGVDDLPSSDEEGDEDVDNDTSSEEVAQESNLEDKWKRVSPALNAWTDERIREFWDYLQNHSIDLTAAKFNICKNSVYKYRKKFADHPAVINPYIADKVEEMVEVRFDDLVNDISACANIIKCCISDQDIFWSPKYGMKKEFYNSISAALYYSLLEYYGIEEDENKNAIIPEFDMNPQFLSEVKWLHQVGEFYRSEKSINWFGRTNRFMKSDMYVACPLDSEWVDKFALQLERRFGIEVNIEDLVDYVRDRFSK